MLAKCQCGHYRYQHQRLDIGKYGRCQEECKCEKFIDTSRGLICSLAERPWPTQLPLHSTENFMDLNVLAERLVNAANQGDECQVTHEEFDYLMKAFPSSTKVDELEQAILRTGKLTTGWGTEVRLRIFD